MLTNGVAGASRSRWAAKVSTEIEVSKAMIPSTGARRAREKLRSHWYSSSTSVTASDISDGASSDRIWSSTWLR